MARKLIGLTGPSMFTTDCIKMIEEYFKADFVLLYHNDADNLQSWLKKCDGFMVAGGVDIHPSLYMQNALNDFNLSKFDFMRDCRELAIINYAMENKVPMLGICRGHQLLGVYCGLGMDFEMDVSRGHVVHSPHKAQINYDKEDPMHYVEILDQKRFPVKNIKERETVHKIMAHKEDKYVWVNSFHHQAVAYNKSRKYHEAGVEVLGVAPVTYGKNKRFIIELMRGKTWISCQWHPEFDYDVNTPSRTVLDVWKSMLEGNTE